MAFCALMEISVCKSRRCRVVQGITAATTPTGEATSTMPFSRLAENADGAHARMERGTSTAPGYSDDLSETFVTGSSTAVRANGYPRCPRQLRAGLDTASTCSWENARIFSGRGGAGHQFSGF